MRCFHVTSEHLSHVLAQSADGLVLASAYLVHRPSLGGPDVQGSGTNQRWATCTWLIANSIIEESVTAAEMPSREELKVPYQLALLCTGACVWVHGAKDTSHEMYISPLNVDTSAGAATPAL